MTDSTDRSLSNGNYRYFSLNLITPERRDGIYIITPEIARTILDKFNLKNRPQRPEDIKKLARILKRKEWVLSHQGMAFSAQGFLADGQHRLEACVLANMPIVVRIFFGLSEKEVEVIDQNRSRTPTDSFRLIGIEENHRCIEIAKRLVMQDQKMKLREQPTLGEIKEYIDAYGEGIRWAIARLLKRATRNTICAVAVARAYYVAEKNNQLNRLQDWCDIFTNGYSPNGKNCPAQRMIEVFEKADTRSNNRWQEVYWRCEAALDAFLRGRSLAHVKQTRSGEMFPLPPKPKIVTQPAMQDDLPETPSIDDIDI